LKKSFELLRSKLSKEGLFAIEKKRQLPMLPEHVAVISSTGAAGYSDFMKIIEQRWGGITLDVAQVQVQGEVAPMQIMRALEYFNQQETLPEVIVIIRGGGSADDLAAFNDEPLVRAVAASRVPVLTGIGHEVDESLVDLAADVRASTPSNAAERLVPDKKDVLERVHAQLRHIAGQSLSGADAVIVDVQRTLERAWDSMRAAHDAHAHQLDVLRSRAAAYDPTKVLARGYAVVRGPAKVGAELAIETATNRMKAEVTYVEQK
jgi:exodeoxyribonuclease VII large subunit